MASVDTSGGSELFESDEPLEDVVAAFGPGPHRKTRKPRGRHGGRPGIDLRSFSTEHARVDANEADPSPGVRVGQSPKPRIVSSRRLWGTAGPIRCSWQREMWQSTSPGTPTRY